MLCLQYPAGGSRTLILFVSKKADEPVWGPVYSQGVQFRDRFYSQLLPLTYSFLLYNSKGSCLALLTGLRLWVFIILETYLSCLSMLINMGPLRSRHQDRIMVRGF